MSEDELEFRQQWSSCGGRLAATKELVAKISARAGTEFTEGNDQLAKYLRQMAKDFQLKVDALSADLDVFIKQARKPQP